MHGRFRLVPALIAGVLLMLCSTVGLGADDRARPRARSARQHSDAQRRHIYGSHRNYEQYAWRNYDDRRMWQSDRFPRTYYGGMRRFDGTYYRGYQFGPHYRLWFREYGNWSPFYWPYPDAPDYGCRWYRVPTDRVLRWGSGIEEEYWGYSGYRHVRLCFG